MSGEGLRALAQAATPGPWEDVRVPFRDSASYSLKSGDKVLALVGWEREEPVRAPADAAFIAAANPTAVLALLDEVDHWKAHAEEAGKGFAQVCRDSARMSARNVELSRERDDLYARAETTEAERDALRAQVERVRALADEWSTAAQNPMPRRAEGESQQDQGVRIGVWHSVKQATTELRAALDPQ